MWTSDFRRDQIKYCKDRTSNEFDAELRIVNFIDQKYYELLKKGGTIKSQTHPQIANYALAIRSYRALHCAADVLENGYYEYAMTLLRAVYENMLQMKYFAMYREEATQYLYESKDFPPREVRKRLGKSGHTYSMLSEDYAHSLNIRSLIPLTAEGSGKDWRVDPLPRYSSYYCHFCLFCWIDFAGGTLKQLLKDFEIALTTSERVRVLGVLIATRECIAAMSLYLDIMREKELIEEQLKNTFVSPNKVG